MKNLFFFILTLLSFQLLTAQEIEKKWQLKSIENNQKQSSSKINNTDFLTLKKGEFSFSTTSIISTGDYIHQNNLLVFYYNTPKDTIRKYKIQELTDSTFVFKEKNITYNFTAFKNSKTVISQTENSTIIPSQGFSTNSLWRGVLGMISLLFIAFLFSNNKKAIQTCVWMAFVLFCYKKVNCLETWICKLGHPV